MKLFHHTPHDLHLCYTHDMTDSPVTRELPANALTLRRHPDATVTLPMWDEERDLVQCKTEPWPLTDSWQKVELENGTTVEIRRADCGLGCRCAGEYR